ncbi:MAG: gp436 family protein [Desulfobulbaceae bacterium]|jgi:phage gp36-like protein
MASYAVLADVQDMVDSDELVRLTDDAGSGVADEALITSQLAKASAEMDGYLGARYALPLATPPAILVSTCVDIAVFNMYARRQGPPEHWAARYKNAIAFLTKVAEGKISLGAGDPDGNATAAAPEISGPPRIFSRDKLSGF